MRYITPQPSLDRYSGYRPHRIRRRLAHGGPSYEARRRLRRADHRGQARVSGQRLGPARRRLDQPGRLPQPPGHGRQRQPVGHLCPARGAGVPADRSLTITPAIDYQKRDLHNYDDYWLSISDPAAGVPQRHSGPDGRLGSLLRAHAEDRMGPRASEGSSPTLPIITASSGRGRIQWRTSTTCPISSTTSITDPALSIYGYPSDPQGQSVHERLHLPLPPPDPHRPQPAGPA